MGTGAAESKQGASVASNDNKKPKPSLAVREYTHGVELWSPLDGGLCRLEIGASMTPKKKVFTPANFSGEWKAGTALATRGEMTEDKNVIIFTGDSGASASMGKDPYNCLVNYKKAIPDSHYIVAANGTESEIALAIHAVMRLYLAATLSDDPDGPLFPRVLYIHALQTIQHLGSRLGFDPRDFGTHSPRRGGAYDLLQAGASPEEVRVMGRWNFDCWLKFYAELAFSLIHLVYL